MPIPAYFDIRKQIAAEWLSNDEYQIANTPNLRFTIGESLVTIPEEPLKYGFPLKRNNMNNPRHSFAMARIGLRSHY